MKVTVNKKEYAEGTLIEIPLLGAFENGTTTEVSAAKADKFVSANPDFAGKKELVFGETKSKKAKADPVAEEPNEAPADNNEKGDS